MGSSTTLTGPRQVLLEKLRERLSARLAGVERRLIVLKGEFEKLELERIDLGGELLVIQKEAKKGRGNGND